MSNNYTILHLHSSDSNPKSGLQIDSVTPFQAYIPKIVECGMKAVAFTEHGAVLHNVSKKQLCEKNGIKYIHAEEFYITESIDQDNLIRDNYHCLLYAKNKEGAEELNWLSSIASQKDGHVYYQPRISLEELEHTTDNIMILTGCIAGMLSRGTKEVQERFLKFVIANKNRCWLEIQPHCFDYQVQYNKYLYKISQEYGLRLIATNDIHAVNEEHLLGRKIMQKSKKIEFHDEDACDLSFKDYDGMVAAFTKQRALPEEIFLDALEETNRFAAEIENYKLDYSNKYPRTYKDAKTELKNRIKKGIKERGIDKLPNYKSEYIPRINEEFKTYVHNDAVDFILLDSDYKLWMKDHNMAYGPSRGSVSGSEIAYLIHCTDVDSVKYKLNFSRFLNPDRVSLADVDTDIYADDRYAVREYFFNRDDVYCCNILTFNTIQMRGAIKDIARALDYTPEEAQKISNTVYTDENGKDAVPEEIRYKYWELFKYVDIVIGTITSLGRHAAGIVISPTDPSKDFGTVYIESDPRPVSQIDMHEIDSLNYVKLDLLGLNAVGLIDKACKLAGIPFRTLDNTDMNDEKVIRSIAEDTTMIFQFESGFASDSLKKMLSPETIKKIKQKVPDISYLALMSMVNGAIRPAGESFRDQMFSGEFRDNGNEALNNFLAPTLDYLTYQEQVLDFLHDFCGFTMGQADIVRRGFAKKTGTEKYIPIIKDGGYMEDIYGNKDDRYIPGYIATVQEKYGMNKEEAESSIEYFLRVIDDASSYLFSKNHSDPYSAIGYFIGWLRYYYPLQLLTAALNVYKANEKKMNEIKAYTRSKGIKIKPIKFRKSRADYFMDVNENAIYQDIESIKEMNAKGAEELYELGKNHYDSFIQLLADIKEKCCYDKNQLDILIKLDFFSEFGDVNDLLKMVDIYESLYKRKQFNKSDLKQYGVPEEQLKKYVGKETAKLYKDVDVVGLISELVSNINEPKLSSIEHIKYEIDLLGYATTVDPSRDKREYLIEDISSNKAVTKLKLYEIYSGKTRECSIWNTLWGRKVALKNDVLYIISLEKKHKKEPTGEINPKTGKKIYQDIPDQYEYWLQKYEVIPS